VKGEDSWHIFEELIQFHPQLTGLVDVHIVSGGSKTYEVLIFATSHLLLLREGHHSRDEVGKLHGLSIPLYIIINQYCVKALKLSLLCLKSVRMAYSRVQSYLPPA
jgi:hypothetical protein